MTSISYDSVSGLIEISPINWRTGTKVVVFCNLTGQLGQLALTETICLSDSVCCITYEPLLTRPLPAIPHIIPNTHENEAARISLLLPPFFDHYLVCGWK